MNTRVLIGLSLLLSHITPVCALSVIGDCVTEVENGAAKQVRVVLQTNTIQRDHTTVLINTSSGVSKSPQDSADPKAYIFSDVEDGEWFIQCDSCCVREAATETPKTP